MSDETEYNLFTPESKTQGVMRMKIKHNIKAEGDGVLVE